MSRLKHPYEMGDRVKALWLDKIGTCLVTAEVTATSIDPDRSRAPYGIALTHQDKTINAWVRADGTDLHQYIAPAKG